ncbi:meckelin-like [Epargyreus clarus]|uniref:meckelin-like n=1 Tax=Epargyreus clarus TaxID=520877 RepID=UPI003C301520
MFILAPISLIVVVSIEAQGLKLPGECTAEQFFDPGSMECQSCPANVSMVVSDDGFACSCEEHSVPVGSARCKPCNAVEMVSEDGLACVPRRCQVSSGRIVCRKCPNDYILVTQGFDGAALKEVLCVKCARGYKARDNKCVKCEACLCTKNEAVVHGVCVPKKYVNDRPKYQESVLHPSTLLEIVKQEYLCTKHDLRACRTLARMCVKNFYGSDAAGPCRLWLQPNLTLSGVLPMMTLPSISSKNAEELTLGVGQKGAWSSGKFKKFFIMDSFLSTIANVTNTIYLRSLTVQVKIERDKHSVGSLHLLISIVAQYTTKSPLSDTITMTLRIENEMPVAGVLRGLEIWGGLLGTMSLLYAAVQWRGVVRRGGLHVALVPILSGAVADALYFAALFSTVYALSAEAGTLGIALPLSHDEETVIRAFAYTVVSLKILKVLWINWCQCRCDIFFIDWSEYNPPLKDPLVYEQSKQWKTVLLAKELISMQARRRASPGVTVTLTLILLHLMGPWQSYLPKSEGYKWAVANIALWSAYTTTLLVQMVYDKIRGPPTSVLPKVCRGVGLSLLVFQEDLYAHYVHGRYDDSFDSKSMAGPLAMCRVVCAPQLRAVYKKLATPGYGNLPNRILLTRFLAAFFERALDGLHWVGSERTIVERLFDVEVTAREGGATSALLYDPNNTTPSCFAVTWWGEEWTLATFDVMLFGCALLATDHALSAALATLIAWQIMKVARTVFGIRNIKEKIEVEV